jgi:signal transduction histidine kinase
MSATTEPSRIPLGSRFSAAPNRAEQTEIRIGLAITAAAAVIAVLAALFYLTLALQWRGEAFIGALVTHTLTVDGSLPLSGEAWSGLNAGLQRGDHIIGANGDIFPASLDEAEAEFDALLRSLQPGDQIRLTFERPTPDGRLSFNNAEGCTTMSPEMARCQLTYTLSRFPDVDFLASFLVPFVSGLITLGIGIVVLVLRSRSTVAQVISGVCITLSIFMLGIFDINTTRQLTPFWLIGTTFVGSTMAALAFVFPVRLPIASRRPGIQWVAVALGAVVAGCILLIYHNPSSPQNAVTTIWLAVGFGMVGMAFLAFVLLRRRRSATTLAVRDQSNTVLIGILLSLIMGVVWLLDILGRLFFNLSPLPLNTSAATPFLILPPLSMAYAILQYRSIDTDRVISQAMTYTVLLVALIVGYFLLVLSASLLAGEVLGANNPILLAIVIFVMAVLFVPVRSRLQARVDRLYYRRKLNYQENLERFTQRLGSLISHDDIINAYLEELNATLQPSQMFIFIPDRQTGDFTAPNTDIRFAADSPLVQYLTDAEPLLVLDGAQPWNPAAVAERSRLLILKATLVVALRGSNRISGFVCIAPPRAAGGYGFDELGFVQALSTQISVAVERAEVVDSLEHRVRELDVLSQVSQAVNFTVNLDDLLELIYAQTVRLIDATHFYITLRDATTDDLYHAFFLENGERYTEKENVRWDMGRDVFSQIIRSGRLLALTDSAAIRADRSRSIRYDDADIQAWVGVPMLAGSRVMGVMAAGTTQPGAVYSADQRKIFSDIGALAATSLDKARLFVETDVRARQLSALNDITRQIVAAELDLEKLLQLITASATNILGADAGSLLLTTEDGSGDLEFRVAVGGSGEELIGSRLPAGKGLVGEVASSGQPVIVSDVGSDPRWGGELSSGAFHTTTVVAVPLVTQNNVIGVLEVLNKKNGASFNRDDVDLLTVFASQAAVAIENARLFQMTDLQLSERLSELETLERIDVELNRSLDLQKVAQISLQWALENSSATAGLIGIISGEPARMEIVYSVGYEPDDLPTDENGVRLPLDRGIVSRVLRTKQADLVPNVHIDPDYTPSLPNALSQITLPMLSGGEVNALIILETDREPRLRLADMPFLQRLAEHASIAIVNAQLYAELTRANESKSEFVSFVAHELKNPLTSIQGYSDVLIKGAAGGLSDQQKNFLGTIRANAARMNTLVSDLNDVTKLQTDNLRMDLKPISFRQALDETLPPLQKQIDDKGQQLDLNVPDDLPPIHADLNRLVQVLTNMVSNAHKYTPENGAIRISAFVDSSLMDNRGRRLDPALHIAVADTGIGMSPEDLNKLFTAYFRSDNPLTREQPGTGLGLTITRGIIERHGGMVWVESELNVGTTFHFTIPLYAEPAPSGD